MLGATQKSPCRRSADRGQRQTIGGSLSPVIHADEEGAAETLVIDAPADRSPFWNVVKGSSLILFAWNSTDRPSSEPLPEAITQLRIDNGFALDDTQIRDRRRSPSLRRGSPNDSDC